MKADDEDEDKDEGREQGIEREVVGAKINVARPSDKRAITCVLFVLIVGFLKCEWVVDFFSFKSSIDFTFNRALNLKPVTALGLLFRKFPTASAYCGVKIEGGKFEKLMTWRKKKKKRREKKGGGEMR